MHKKKNLSMYNVNISSLLSMTKKWNLNKGNKAMQDTIRWAVPLSTNHKTEKWIKFFSIKKKQTKNTPPKFISNLFRQPLASAYHALTWQLCAHSSFIRQQRNSWAGNLPNSIVMKTANVHSVWPEMWIWNDWCQGFLTMTKSVPAYQHFSYSSGL